MALLNHLKLHRSSFGHPLRGIEHFQTDEITRSVVMKPVFPRTGRRAYSHRFRPPAPTKIPCSKYRSCDRIWLFWLAPVSVYFTRAISRDYLERAAMHVDEHTQEVASDHRLGDVDLSTGLIIGIGFVGDCQGLAQELAELDFQILATTFRDC